MQYARIQIDLRIAVWRVAIEIGPDVADVMAFRPIILWMVNTSNSHLDRYMTYPGKYFNEIRLQRHAENILHPKR